MKRLVVESETDGLMKLIGQQVQLWCMNYIYTGKLVGVNDADVCIADASVVYETGKLNTGTFKDAQKHAPELFVRTSAIESYCVVGRD